MIIQEFLKKFYKDIKNRSDTNEMIKTISVGILHYLFAKKEEKYLYLFIYS